MKVINGIKEFKLLLEHDTLEDKIRFWNDSYFTKYNSILSHQLTNLYHADSSVFHQFIETLDKEDILRTIDKIDFNLIDRIEKIIKSVTSQLSFNVDFDVYLMIGFGHVMGTSGFNNRPFVYFGMETLFSEFIDLEYLIAHEINHMVRIATIEIYQNKLGMSGMSFGDVMILEGLGVVNSVVFDTNSIEFNRELFRKSLMISEDFYKHIESNELVLKDKLIAKWNTTMTSEDWFEYFIVNGEESVMGPGYYIGGKLVYEALSKGYTMSELTTLPTNEYFKGSINTNR